MRKTVLVTGSSSGIGKEIARILAKDSQQLIVVERSLIENRMEKIWILKQNHTSDYYFRYTISAICCIR